VTSRLFAVVFVVCELLIIAWWIAVLFVMRAHGVKFE